MICNQLVLGVHRILQLLGHHCIDAGVISLVIHYNNPTTCDLAWFPAKCHNLPTIIQTSSAQ